MKHCSISRQGDGYISSIRTPAREIGPTGTRGLDDLDLRILRLLNADARKSFRDIAKAVDASLSTVSNRVRKLEEEGIIKGYAPILNEGRLGYDVLAVVGVKIH